MLYGPTVRNDILSDMNEWKALSSYWIYVCRVQKYLAKILQRRLQLCEQVYILNNAFFVSIHCWVVCFACKLFKSYDNPPHSSTHSLFKSYAMFFSLYLIRYYVMWHSVCMETSVFSAKKHVIVMKNPYRVSEIPTARTWIRKRWDNVVGLVKRSRRIIEINISIDMF